MIDFETIEMNSVILKSLPVVAAGTVTATGTGAGVGVDNTLFDVHVGAIEVKIPTNIYFESDLQ